MATIPDTFLGRRFAAYAADAPPADAAVSCRELAERVAYGLHLHQLVQECCQAIRASLRASGKPYDLPAAKYVEQLMALWVTPAIATAKQVNATEAKGCEVERSAEFRQAVLDTRVSLSIPVERAAAISERIAREGLSRGHTTEDLRRELRHRMGA